MTKRMIKPLALLLPLAFAGQVRADNIYLVDGTDILDVEVKNVDVNEVVYTQAGKTIRLESWKVEHVQFEKSPVSFVRAYQAYLDDAQDAPELFVACLEDRRDLRAYRWLEPTVKFFEAQAYRSTRRSRTAMTKLQEFVDEPRYSKSLYYPQALQILVNLYTRTKNKRAPEMAQRLVSEAESGKIPLKWKFDAKLFLIRRIKDQVKMRAALDELLKDKDIAKYPDIGCGIQNTQAGIEIKEGKFKEAEQRFLKVAATPKASAGVFAEAFLGLGICRFAEWERVQGAEQAKLNDSTWRSLLHPYVVYKANLTPEQSQEMLYKAAKIFKTMGSPEDLERVKRLVLEIQKYPASPWRTKAEKL